MHIKKCRDFSSQASLNFHVEPRLISGYRIPDSLLLFNSPKARNRGFEFQKRRQLFLSVHNEPLSVVAMCVCDPDRSSARIDG